MAGINVIITGATGMVGEGVLLECLKNKHVEKVLIVNRRHYELTHPKLQELIVEDFFELDKFRSSLENYDACFFCAGISSIGMKEEKFKRITYHTTLSFAKTLLGINKNMVFTYVSGSGTDSSEKGKTMWARVKGKTENDLVKLGFKGAYNFRPGVMVPLKGQRNWKKSYEHLAKLINFFAPKYVLKIDEVGRAMITCVLKGYSNNILEIKDIRALSKII